jgi:hypothetical protein
MRRLEEPSLICRMMERVHFPDDRLILVLLKSVSYELTCVETALSEGVVSEIRCQFLLKVEQLFGTQQFVAQEFPEHVLRVNGHHFGDRVLGVGAL